MWMPSSALATLAVLALAGAPPAGGDPEPACVTLCADAGSNYSIKQCLAHELEVAEGEMDRYLQAARDEWKFEPDTGPDAEAARAMDAFSRAIPETLDRAQAAWRAYVDADCDAVGAIWTTGSGRGAAVLHCKLVHARRRSIDLWEHYLQLGTELQEPRQVCEP